MSINSYRAAELRTRMRIDRKPPLPPFTNAIHLCTCVYVCTLVHLCVRVYVCARGGIN